MPTITLNRKVVEELTGKKLPLDKLKDRISMLGTDLESINEKEIIVEIFPNRPDLLSEQGFARALSSFIGVKKGLRNYRSNKSSYKVVIDKSVKEVRPYTACAVIKNLNFSDERIREVIQIQEKLHVTYGRNRKKVAIGIYPLEKIKFPINYVAKKPTDIRFVPLESKDKLNGLEILKEHPAGKEYGYLLENEKLFPIFIDSNNEIMSMPPIINSDKTGKITVNTTEVFIECSGFDFDVLSKCLNIIVTALADMKGEIYEVELDYGKKRATPDLKAERMKLDVNYVNQVLGLELKENEIKNLLEKMGFAYINKDALIPCYRTDILHQIDLVEDIAIAYGYENFKEEIPRVMTIGEEDGFEMFKNKVSEVFVGLGLLEVSTYNISNANIQRKKMNCDVEVVELQNALTTDYNVLRSWMVPCLLDVLSKNKHHDYPQNLFDIGVVFKREKDEIKEDCRLGVALCNMRADFTRIKQAFDVLFSELGLSYEIKDVEHGSFIKGRVGRIIVNGRKIAYIGEIHPSVLRNFELEMPVAAFELNLSELYNVVTKRI